MRFNYVDTMVALSPLDFNYKFGLNNNEPEHFRCDNLNLINISTEKDAEIEDENIQFNMPNLFSYNKEETKFILDGFVKPYTPVLSKIELSKTERETMERKNSEIIEDVVMKSILEISTSMSNSSSTLGSAMNMLSIINNIISIGQMLDKYQANLNEINKKIDLLNEYIDTNKEFIREHTKKIEDNQNKLIRTKIKML